MKYLIILTLFLVSCNDNRTNKENEETRLIKISEVEVYKPNNLTNIPYTLPIPMYSGTY